jgi:hypothetical protein
MLARPDNIFRPKIEPPAGGARIRKVMPSHADRIAAIPVLLFDDVTRSQNDVSPNRIAGADSADSSVAISSIVIKDRDKYFDK